MIPTIFLTNETHKQKVCPLCQTKFPKPVTAIEFMYDSYGSHHQYRVAHYNCWFASQKLDISTTIEIAAGVQHG